MFIYHSQKPRVLKNTRKEDLPVMWYSNRKTWITENLFRDEFMHHYVCLITQYNKHRRGEPLRGGATSSIKDARCATSRQRRGEIEVRGPNAD